MPSGNGMTASLTTSEGPDTTMRQNYLARRPGAGRFQTDNDVSCPRTRPGARLRLRGTDDLLDALDGRAQLTRVTGTDVGCCEGYGPVPCTVNEHCFAAMPGGPVGCIGGWCHVVWHCGDSGPQSYFGQDCLPTGTIVEVACLPNTCTGDPEPVYCEDRAPDLDEIADLRMRNRLCASDGECQAAYDLAGFGWLINDPDHRTLDATLGALHNAACAPGSKCDPSYGKGAPLALRQLTSHYAIRTILLGLDDDDTGLLSLLAAGQFSANIPIPLKDRQVEAVRIEWKPHKDGELVLQGYLEVNLKMEGDRIEADTTVTRALTNFDIRIRMQPYFFPQAPPYDNHCDDCGRRRPEMSMGWRIVSAGLFRTNTDESINPGEAFNCGCVESALNCILGCANLSLGSSFEEIGENLNPLVLQELRTDDFEGGVATLMHYLMHDPLLGGVVIGRLDAVRAMAEMPACQTAQDGSGQLMPAQANPSCTSAWSAFTGRRANTVEALRIRQLVGGQPGAVVLARDNP
jgi:hypothetical protein